MKSMGVVLLGLLTVASPNRSDAAERFGEAERLFTLRVKPLLTKKCFGCHGKDPSDIKGELNVATRDDLLKGGESSGEVLVPGDAESSLILSAVRWDEIEMPPKDSDRLTEEQISLIRDWIDAGAPWPDETRQAAIRAAEEKVSDEGFMVATSGGLSDDWTFRRYQPENLWAFRPLEKPVVPAVGTPRAASLQEAEHGRSNAIDAFVGAKRNEAGFEPAPRADRFTLLRRATYDLLGLPPTPEQVDAFLDDDSPSAYEDLIDRLLQSPRYGERWGQHWLDVVRYADTSGYSNDWERSNAWRYRDYVVRAFNDDKPYDRFILEQIAGDELDPDDPEMLVAVGFLRMGPWEHTGMAVAKLTRQQFLDDVVNSVGQTFLSTAMRCCKCHDHKFDPIPTRDYYRMYAAFATTQPAERDVPFLDCENTDSLDAARVRVQAQLDFATTDKKRVEVKREAAARQWYEERGKPYVPADERFGLPDHEKPPRNVGLDHVDEGTLKVRKQDQRIWRRRLERFEPMAQSVYNGRDTFQQSVKLRVPSKEQASDGKTSEPIPESYIYSGGSVFAPSDVVTPGVLSAIALPTRLSSSDDNLYALPRDMSGRRLALAEWIADPDNPLAIRSIVNRVWHFHFGKGIAGNPNNFGATGQKPTHAELLDWLAIWFADNGWSIKKLHKLIMMSETYRQSGRHPQMDGLKEKDPNNELLAYFAPRRLTAEELRDSMLAVSGELILKMGGIPARPEINIEVALQPRMLQGSLAPAYQPSPTPSDRNRRSIYAYRVRGQADPFLEVFNQPNSIDSCEIRDALTVTPQVFTLMNSDVTTDRSIAFALRLVQECESLEGQINRAFQLAFGRMPSGAESVKLATFVKEMVLYHEEHPPISKSVPTMVTRSLVEEFTGLAFELNEWLNIYETEYVPDRKAWTVDARTRALADVCVILFNSHEFVYVY